MDRTNRLGTILGVWAHPDDETWLSAVHMLRAVRSGDRVVWVTNRPEWLEMWHPELEALGVYMGAEPPSTPETELRSFVRVDEDERDAKYLALTSQVSQIRPLVEAFGADRFRSALSEESFR